MKQSTKQTTSGVDLIGGSGTNRKDVGKGSMKQNIKQTTSKETVHGQNPPVLKRNMVLCLNFLFDLGTVNSSSTSTVPSFLLSRPLFFKISKKGNVGELLWLEIMASSILIRLTSNFGHKLFLTPAYYPGSFSSPELRQPVDRLAVLCVARPRQRETKSP